MTECKHDLVTSTFQTGPICNTCREPLVSLFWPIDRNSPAGIILHTMKASKND